MAVIDREDMLTLTRRMTISRTSFTRIAGSYMDRDGYIDGTFNTSFLKLSPREKEANLAIARAIPFAETNMKLRRYRFPEEAGKAGGMRQLLLGMKSCGLKNDALLDTFYEFAAENYRADHDYGILLFHDRFDIPVKAADHERLGESEEMFEYLICAFCPLAGDYDPGMPECGFLFPAFSGRSEDREHVDVFQADPMHPHRELMKILGVREDERLSGDREILRRN